jgi:membrane associated rhomboid family serine protease
VSCSDLAVTDSKQPIFNVPGVLLGFIAIFWLVHAGRAYLLSPVGDYAFVETLGFVPVRYGEQLWSFVTYAFIHGNLLHLGMNTIWFLPFGAAVARRFGSWRFILFFVLTAAAGAFLHLLTHFGDPDPMIGASAAISGCMAAAARFVFQPGGPLEAWREADLQAYNVPAASLGASFRDYRIITFLAVWFGLNVLFGGSGAIIGEALPVAWQAHIGGFVAGLLAFSAFDPIRNMRQSDLS